MKGHLKMNRRLLTIAAATLAMAGTARADIELYAPEADTLATVTARGATSAQSLTLTGSTPLTLGADAATNTAGWLKLWGAGANDYYTTITAGTQTQNVAYTLPADDGTSGQALTSDGSGALSWSSFLTVESDTLATVTARGATTAQSLTLTGATPLALGEDIGAGTTNTPGYFKLWSNGDNAYAATLTAGTMTASGAWLWFTAQPAATYLLNCTAAGQLGYDTTAYFNEAGDTGTGIWDLTGATLSGASPLVFEGNSADDFETTLAVEDPTTPDKTVTIPNLTGTLLVDTAENAGNVTILGTLGLGKDDDTSTLTIHHAGTMVFNDASDDTSVTLGPVGDGTTILGVTGALAASGDLTGNGGLGVDLISQAVAVADFTDNTDATGYIDLTPKLPAGAIVLGWECVVTAGFTGDTSATVQVGVEGTLDKYSATTANSVLVDDTTVGSSVKDGNVYCAAVTTVRVTVTGDADFTSIKTANHGAMTVKVFYICTP